MAGLNRETLTPEDVLNTEDKVKDLRAAMAARQNAAVALEAGDKMAVHSHPDHLVYVIAGGKVRFTGADGKVTENRRIDGRATV